MKGVLAAEMTLQHAAYDLLVIAMVTDWCLSTDLGAVAEADYSHSSSSSVDVQLLNHIVDEAEYVRLVIIEVRVACRFY